ncbi:15-O-acetyltransferase Tri3 [Rhizoctonia solani]|uniref:15-O-acetyltransferase Tri3 n=1 Tax=Rhizoctonia solani TaxID=456999 RepID=A0A8H7I2H5_9AGAM|nr:15-O-acetyltransferase Tri3 [Rhizoctonia solani]
MVMTNFYLERHFGSLEAIEERLLAALIRLRYYSPLVAAQPQKGIHDNELRSWVYTPVFDNQAAASWARKVLTVKASTKQLPDAESHVCDILSQPLPPNEIFQVHLIGPHQDGQFTLFTYKSHALAEGQSAIDLLATLSDWIINPDAGPAHALRPQRESITKLGKIVRTHRQLDETTTSRLVQATRSEGISITHLFEAAHAIATYTIEPLSAEELAESHVRYFPSIPLRQTTVRDRVLAIAQEVKNNYRAFIANPQHPLMEATLIKLYPLRGPLGVDINANTGEILGLGIIDNKLPLVWRSSDGHHTIRINDVHLGLRQCNKRPMVHLWTLEGKLRIQIQASDVWDESYLARFLDEVIKCALSIC